MTDSFITKTVGTQKKKEKKRTLRTADVTLFFNAFSHFLAEKKKVDREMFAIVWTLAHNQ